MQQNRRPSWQQLPRTLRQYGATQDPPRIASWNCCSLNAAKVAYLLRQQWDVLCLQEIWDPPEADVRHIRQAGFDVFITRRERQRWRNGGPGASVGVFVRKASRHPPISNAEVTAVTIRSVDGQSLRVASVYLPPATPTDVDVWLAPLFSSVDVVVGDFNARHVAWCPTALEAPNCSTFTRGAALQKVISNYEWTLSSDVSPAAATTTRGHGD